MLSITIIIIIITVIVSFSAFSNQKIMDDLIFYPPAITQQNQWYRFFSCGLIHADWGHLFFNMLSLYFFGPAVEDALNQLFPGTGKWLYLIMYVSALLVSLLPTYFKNKNNYSYRSLGASGAVSAVLFAGLMLMPQASIYMFFIPIPIPGFIFGPLYLVISAFMGRSGRTNINHSAHIWGAIYGLLFIIIASEAAGYDIFSAFLYNVKSYLRTKGWM